eukprot:10514877-Lingulodinium_polyedra.AAC.1
MPKAGPALFEGIKVARVQQQEGRFAFPDDHGDVVPASGLLCFQARDFLAFGHQCHDAEASCHACPAAASCGRVSACCDCGERQ